MTNCIQCGKEFKQKFKREKFCSTNCYAKYRKKPLTKLTCPICKEDFYRKGSSLKQDKTYFCSRSCSSKSRRVYPMEVRACLECGEEFTVISKSKKRCCCCDCAAKIRSKEHFQKKLIELEKELNVLDIEFDLIYNDYVINLSEY